MKITSELLYKIRKAYRLTQADIGALCDVSDAYINLIENGKRNITDRISHSITKELELTPDKLAQILAVYEEYNRAFSIYESAQKKISHIGLHPSFVT
jgi:transcriptional regulator with XRE-family HTH domain